MSNSPPPLSDSHLLLQYITITTQRHPRPPRSSLVPQSPPSTADHSASTPIHAPPLIPRAPPSPTAAHTRRRVRWGHCAQHSHTYRSRAKLSLPPRANNRTKRLCAIVTAAAVQRTTQPCYPFSGRTLCPFYTGSSSWAYRRVAAVGGRVNKIKHLFAPSTSRLVERT